MRSKSVIECIEEQEYRLAKLKFVQSVFPDIRIVNNYDPLDRWKALNVEFIAKSVNTEYTDVKFITKHNTLFIAPICNLTFNYVKGNEEKTEEIIVGSSPKTNRLAYIKYDRKMGGPADQRRRIAFSRFVFNMKKHDFSDKIFNSCRSAIMKFVQDNPGITMDMKHLEPRLQKLLVYI